ncbi:MAG TPA: FtsX-like permease family protein [Steroidobacteraceae bacterium]|nr:FtsX-like permease family protein [Steroidobacteraceae bacterium]
MNLQLRPALTALWRNHTGALLVAAQIGVALAVLVNAACIVHQRIAKMSRPTGIDYRNEFVVWSQAFTDRFDFPSALREDISYLRGLPGVVDATQANSVPMGWSNNSTEFRASTDPNAPRVQLSMFNMDDHAINTLGTHLIAGRNFRPDEILPPLTVENPSEFVPVLILSRDAAQKLYGSANAVGKAIYDDAGHAATVIGVIENVISTSWGVVTGSDQIVLIPRHTYKLGPSWYLVRTQPGERDALMRTVEEHMSRSNPNRVIQRVDALEMYKDTLYRDDRNMAIFLLTVTVLVLIVTCVGIVGLVTFNVSTRTRQIGTRRALGARCRDVIRYFLVENALVTTTGILAGVVLALGVGYLLSLHFQLPRLDLLYLLAGVLALWLIALLSAWQPARRAATVAPAVATRTL